MSTGGYRAEQASGRDSDVPLSGSGRTSDGPMGFDCCGTMTGDAIAQCPCGSVMRRHPVIVFALAAAMGLAALLVSAGAILGIIAFFRMI